jgi:hypothetical protein
MTGFQSKRSATSEIDIAELKNSLAQAKQKKTLRDEFAMAALPALIGLHRADLRWQDVAPQAYALADKMMKERNQ